MKLKSGFKITRGVSIGDKKTCVYVSNSRGQTSRAKAHAFQKGKSDQTLNFDWLHNKH